MGKYGARCKEGEARGEGVPSPIELGPREVAVPLLRKIASYFIQVTQLSQRDRAAWCVSFGQKQKTDEYFRDIILRSSTTVT